MSSLDLFSCSLDPSPLPSPLSFRPVSIHSSQLPDTQRLIPWTQSNECSLSSHPMIPYTSNERETDESNVWEMMGRMGGSWGKEEEKIMREMRRVYDV